MIMVSRSLEFTFKWYIKWLSFLVQKYQKHMMD